MTEPPLQRLIGELDVKSISRISEQLPHPSRDLQGVRSARGPSRTKGRQRRRGGNHPTPFKETCACGHAINPVYNGTCEDCFAAAQERFSGEDQSVTLHW